MSTESPTPTGRPSTYSPELADTICDYLADGKSLRWICDQEGMPNKGTVLRWARDNTNFRDQYARAREVGDELLAEEILEIADETRFDTLHTEAGPKPDNEWINRSKLRVDARKWLLSKRQPKKYGDKVDVTSGGEKLPVAPRVFQILPASQRPPESDRQEPELA